MKRTLRRIVLLQVVDHYHVDVFAGEEMRYFRGLVLSQDEAETWTIVDDFGVIGERDQRLASGLSLNEAIRRALVMLRETLGEPITPVWATAPYELLGYVRRAPPRRFPWPRRVREQTVDRVGADGRPERS
jgi:hypothetical protein